MRPCQGHFQNRRKCDFLIIFCYLLFFYTQRGEILPTYPEQPSSNSGTGNPSPCFTAAVLNEH